MRTTVFKKNEIDAFKTFSVAVGAFYPWLRHHELILDQVLRLSNASPILCVIYPPPFVLINDDQSKFPVFEPISRLIQYLQTKVDVLLCEMTKDDLMDDFDDFFMCISKQIKTEEMWLAGNQSLGRGKKNSQNAIAQKLAKEGSLVRNYEYVKGAANRMEVFDAIRRGSVRRATELAGRYPAHSVCGSEGPFGWPDGRYVASVVKCSGVALDRERINLRLYRGRIRFENWKPKQGSTLEFLEGPNDLE